jgi:hypothetical protein
VQPLEPPHQQRQLILSKHVELLVRVLCLWAQR